MPDVRKIAFSFITIVVVPLLFFALLELGLKVAGVGTSFDYFHEIDIDGEPHFQENPEFANQFYPPSLNIGPVENTFSMERDPDVVRIFVLGDPQRWASLIRTTDLTGYWMPSSELRCLRKGSK